MKRELISQFLSDPFFATKVHFESLGSITCIIQPASNDDLQILPEGDRYNPTVRIFSREKITNDVLFQPNTAETTKRKLAPVKDKRKKRAPDANKPLIDTGQLRGAITYEVREK